MEQLKGIKGYSVPAVIFILSLIFAGGYHEYVSAFTGAAMLIYLAFKTFKNKQLSFSINFVSIGILAIAFFYGISAFWAIDGGMAFIGFVRLLPVPAFMLLLMQTPEAKEKLIGIVPLIAAVLTAVSIPLMFIPSLDGIFSVADRLAGFFQYPNTFALFLLVAELLVITKEKYKLYDLIIIAVLVSGIYLTGSRTVFVLAVVSNVIALFIKKGKRVKIITAVAVSGVIAVVLCLAHFTDIPLFNRLLDFSFRDSTFVGRLLYYSDALPVILKNPFGLGYMGYYYIQQSIQTGVYSVVHIHNDFLQLLLDIGWIPTLIFVIGIIRSVFSKNISAAHKLIILTMTAHACFDFDLQFVSVFMLYILFLNVNGGKRITFSGKGILSSAVSSVFACVCIYMGVSLFLSRIGQYETSLAMYPANTQAQIQLLLSSQDIKESNDIAEDILNRNEYITVAYSAKARYGYASGDFSSVITNKNKLFDIAPFAYEEYKEYCYMLINGMSLYMENGDNYSVRICRNELINAASELDSMKGKLSTLGKMIKDQPQTELEEEIVKYINDIKTQ